MVKFGPPAPMPDPDPVTCPSPGCPYATPLGLPNHTQVTEHFSQHCRLAHPVQAGQGHAPPAPAKIDRRPRQDMTEHDFRFFESEWGLYKRATGVKNQALVDELWSCMSNPLKKLAFDQGDIENLITEELMMARIKSLAVAVLHTAIHTDRLHAATQLSQPGRRRSTPPSPRGSPPRFTHYTRSGRKLRAVTPHLPPMLAAQTASASQQYEQQTLASPQSVPLCHMEHDPVLGWREAPPLNSLTVQVHLRLHLKTYSAMRLPPPSTGTGRSGAAIKASGGTDTGAQMNILPVKSSWT